MAKKVILFIHGFMGSSKQFKSIMPLLSDCGAEMRCVVLAGHETLLGEFMKSGAEDWQRSVDDCISELREEFDEIYLVGHSMGGLLAVRSAVKCPDKICGIVALGFPIKVHVTYGWLHNAMMAAKPPKEGENPAITAARALSGVSGMNVSGYFGTMPKAFEFFGVVRKSGKEIGRLTVPLTVINSGVDEIVSRKAGRFVKRNLPSAKLIELKNSGHFLFTPEENTLMADAIKLVLAGK